MFFSTAIFLALLQRVFIVNINNQICLFLTMTNREVKNKMAIPVKLSGTTYYVEIQDSNQTRKFYKNIRVTFIVGSTLQTYFESKIYLI